MTTKKIVLYFAVFILFSSIIFWFVLILPVKKYNDFHRQAPGFVENFVNESYPEDLVIDIVNGEVSINEPTPYCMIIGNSLNFGSDVKIPEKTGIVFDENADAGALINPGKSVYSSLCNPIALVGRNFIVYPDTDSENQGSFKIQQISPQVNFEITKELIDNFASELVPKILNFADKIYYSLPFVLSPFILLLFLLSNFWYSWVARIILHKTKINETITKKQVYTKTLLVLFIWTAFNWIIFRFLLNGLFKVSFSLSFPFLNTIIVCLGTVLLEKYYFSKKENNTNTISPVEITNEPQIQKPLEDSSSANPPVLPEQKENSM